MDDFINALYKDKPYPLSWEDGDNLNVTISKDVLQFCAKPDMHALDFLYSRYRKGLQGVILNVEEDINSHLQISVLLGALHQALNSKFVVLILCPDEAVVKWHYYMTWCGMFEIKIIAEDCKVNPEEIDEYRGTILIVTFSNIKLLDSLLDINFFSVIIDKFEEVANKLIVRKLQGNFNIGVTLRNFYTHPDQKLQWSMLNWANQGCVGKLADFYQIDNDNFSSFRDQYKEWWFRLTWNYCDSFVRPSSQKKFELNNKLRGWAEEHNLLRYTLGIAKRKPRAKKVVKGDDDDEIESKRLKKVYNKKSKINKKMFNKVEKSDTEDSNDTIIYELETNKTENSIKVDIINSVEAISENLVLENPKAQENDMESELFPSENLVLENPTRNDSPVLFEKDSSPEVESELFLKSLAMPIDVQKIEIASNEDFINSILKGDSDADESQNTSILEVSEAKVVEIPEDIPSESDNFFKSIFNNGDARSNAEVDIVSTPIMSDVDALVAEVMEMVRE